MNQDILQFSFRLLLAIPTDGALVNVYHLLKLMAGESRSLAEPVRRVTTLSYYIPCETTGSVNVIVITVKIATAIRHVTITCEFLCHHPPLLNIIADTIQGRFRGRRCTRVSLFGSRLSGIGIPYAHA
jgi:hypothetical protein